jgi:hypothetical protein
MANASCKGVVVMALLASSSACSPEQGLDSQELANAHTEPIPGDDPPCDRISGCGTNSPVVDCYGFHDLHLGGRPNDAGLTIPTNLSGRAQIYLADGRTCDLRVEDSEIRAACSSGDVVTGMDLRGAKIPLLHAVGSYHGEYSIRIASVRKTTFATNASRSIFAYTLMVPTIGGAEKNLCSHPSPFRDDEMEKHDLLTMLPPEAIVFEGDRIYAEPKTMSHLPDDGWFNIGCARHALAKLHLTENTIAAQGPAQAETHWKTRQATLKLLAADYCGAGFPFTVAGEPLLWKGRPGEPMDHFYRNLRPTKLEARWNENGAVCLMWPRLYETESADARRDFPDIFAAIRSHCFVPECTNEDPVDLDGALRVSGNP